MHPGVPWHRQPQASKIGRCQDQVPSRSNRRGKTCQRVAKVEERDPDASTGGPRLALAWVGDELSSLDLQTIRDCETPQLTMAVFPRVVL